MDDERAARQDEPVAQASSLARSPAMFVARASRRIAFSVTQRQSTVVCPVRQSNENTHPNSPRLGGREVRRYRRPIPDPCLQPRLHPPTAALVVVRQVLSSPAVSLQNSPTSEFVSTRARSSIRFLPSPHSSRFFRAVALRAVHVSCCNKSLLTSLLQILPFAKRNPLISVS